MSDFIKNALSRGPVGQKWLDSIPETISVCSEKWGLNVLLPFELSYNFVAPVFRTLADGTTQQVVLKISFPSDRESQTEIAAIKHCNGKGMVKLLEEDIERSAVLLEHVLPGIPLSSFDDDAQATQIFLNVMKKMHKPLPEDHPFILLNYWTRAFKELRARNNGGTASLPEDLVTQAESLFEMLIETSAPLVLVHGDLHHDNILSSERAEWLAIDPKGIAAEPAYEVAAMIRNPYEKLKLMSEEELKKLLNSRLDILSYELGEDRKRLAQWCFAQTVLSAVWNVEEAKGPEHCLRVAKILQKML